MDASVCSFKKKTNLLKCVFVEDVDLWGRAIHENLATTNFNDSTVDLIIFQFFFFFKFGWHNIKTFIKQITIYMYFKKVRIIYLSTANKLGSLFRRVFHEHSSNREMNKKKYCQEYSCFYFRKIYQQSKLINTILLTAMIFYPFLTFVIKPWLSIRHSAL